jgi:succinate dehydrogenase/fumarate reductase-like Fe-S protein
MTLGLNLCFAVCAAASSAGRSWSLQRMRRRARSREMGEPGCRSASSAALDDLFSGAAVLRAIAVTIFDSESLDASNHTSVVGGQWSVVRLTRSLPCVEHCPALARLNECYDDLSPKWL